MKFLRGGPAAREGREKYSRGIDRIYEKLRKAGWSPLVRFDKRRDRRSPGEFALFIYDNTCRERFLLESFLGNADVRIENYGIANDGRLLWFTEYNDLPDFRLIFPDGHIILVEVKFDPDQKKATFKDCDTLAYLRHGALVLVILANGRMVGPNGGVDDETIFSLPTNLKYAILGRREIERIRTLPLKNYDKEMGNKSGFQLIGDQIEEYLKPREWDDSCCQEKCILLREWGRTRKTKTPATPPVVRPVSAS